jgi:outer membrane protein
MISVMQSTRRTALMTTAFVALAMTGGAAQATETGLFVNVGIAGLLFDTNASINVAGNPLPNSNVRASNNVTLGLGVGYFFTPNISVMALVGVPPTTKLSGQGGLSGLTLGKVTYGPSILAANYHFRQFGAFQPYVGAGISYTIIFGTDDSAVVNLRVKNAVGAVIRAGFDVMLSDRWGVFFSANKIFVSTNITGSVNPAIPGLGGAPASANISFDPLILFSGVTYRF